METQILFCERQRMNKVAACMLGLLIIPIFGFISYGMMHQLITGIPFGDKPASNWSAVCVLILFAFITCLFFIARLEVKIDDQTIKAQWKPEGIKSPGIQLNTIEKVVVLKKSFLYSIAIGHKYGFKYSDIDNMGGEYAIAVKILNSKRNYYISIKNIDEAVRVLENIKLSQNLQFNIVRSDK